MFNRPHDIENDIILKNRKLKKMLVGKLPLEIIIVILLCNLYEILNKYFWKIPALIINFFVALLHGNVSDASIFQTQSLPILRHEVGQ